MTDFCTLAASLLSQEPMPGWKLAVEVRSAADANAQCQTTSRRAIAAAEVQPPEFSRDRPTPGGAAAIVAPRQPELPSLDPTGQAYLPTPAPTPRTARPASGSQLYQQRTAALRGGRIYTRLSASSYEPEWINAAEQPTYEQWVQLLTAEAGAIAYGQGSNRLTVMVGDSLYLWYPREQLSGDRLWLNQGISGDTTAGVLRRLSAFAAARPDTIHVMVGINDLRRGATDQQVLSNLRQIMRQLRSSHPTAQIYIESILPTRLAELPSDRIRQINAQLAQITQQEGVYFLDLQGYFADANGDLRSDLTTDGLHLSAQGYAVWGGAHTASAQADTSSVAQAPF